MNECLMEIGRGSRRVLTGNIDVRVENNEIEINIIILIYFILQILSFCASFI